MRGYLEFCQVTVEKRGHLLQRQCRAVAQLHRRPDGFAQSVVGNRKGRSLQHVGMPVERAFDVEAGDILAPSDDDVLLAVEDRDEPFVIQRPQVPGAQPAVDDRFRRRLRLVEITAHDVRPLDRDLAHGAVGHRVAVPVDDAQFLYRWMQLARCLWPRLVVVADRPDPKRVGFGHAPAGGDACIGKGLCQLCDLRRRALGPACADVVQRWQGFSHPARRSHQVGRLRGNPQQPGDAVVADQAHRFFRIPFAHQGDLGTGGQAEQENRMRCRHMEEGRDDQSRGARRFRRIGLRRFDQRSNHGLQKP